MSISISSARSGVSCAGRFAFDRRRCDARKRRGETLVECIVAVALLSLAAVPALVALRGSVMSVSDAKRRLSAAGEAHRKAMSAAALARFGEDRTWMPPQIASSAAAQAVFPPLRQVEGADPGEHGGGV